MAKKKETKKRTQSPWTKLRNSLPSISMVASIVGIAATVAPQRFGIPVSGPKAFDPTTPGQDIMERVARATGNIRAGSWMGPATAVVGLALLKRFSGTRGIGILRW